MKRLTLILFALLITFTAEAKKKKLRGWYTYKQLIDRGYTCKPFDGKVWVKKCSKENATIFLNEVN